MISKEKVAAGFAIMAGVLFTTAGFMASAKAGLFVGGVCCLVVTVAFLNS